MRRNQSPGRHPQTAPEISGNPRYHHPQPAPEISGKIRHPSPDDMVCQGFRMDAVTKALWHLKAALDLLRQPFGSDETAALIDLITSLNQEKARLETQIPRIIVKEARTKCK